MLLLIFFFPFYYCYYFIFVVSVVSASHRSDFSGPETDPGRVHPGPAQWSTGLGLGWIQVKPGLWPCLVSAASLWACNVLILLCVVLGTVSPLTSTNSNLFNFSIETLPIICCLNLYFQLVFLCVSYLCTNPNHVKTHCTSS
ncbi:hypothetical protein ABFS83_05G131200 [Erythranthe nasuta]